MHELLPLSMWKLLLTVLTAVIFVTSALVPMAESRAGQPQDASADRNC